MVGEQRAGAVEAHELCALLDPMPGVTGDREGLAVANDGQRVRGRSVDDALGLGLVGEVVPAGQLMVRARELAAKIAQHSPTALALTKRVIWESLDTGLDAGIDNAWKAINEHTAHPDLAEGAAAFVEKRKPRWAPFTSS